MAEILVKRGQIYLVDFARDTPGSMQKVRPALVVQNDAGNMYSTYTIVAAIKHDTPKRLPIYVSLSKGVAGLSKDSVIDCAHIHTVGKGRLLKYYGTAPNHCLAQVDRALTVSLGLGRRNV